MVSEPTAPSIINVNSASMPGALWIFFDQDVTHTVPFPFASYSIVWGGRLYSVVDLEEQNDASRQLFLTQGAETGLPPQISCTDPTGFHTLDHPELPLLPVTLPIPYIPHH